MSADGVGTSQADAVSSSQHAVTRARTTGVAACEKPSSTHPPPEEPLVRQHSAPAGSGEWTLQERSLDKPRQRRVSFINEVVTSSCPLPPPPNDNTPSYLLYVQRYVDAGLS